MKNMFLRDTHIPQYYIRNQYVLEYQREPWPEALSYQNFTAFILLDVRFNVSDINQYYEQYISNLPFIINQ